MIDLAGHGEGRRYRQGTLSLIYAPLQSLLLTKVPFVNDKLRCRSSMTHKGSIL